MVTNHLASPFETQSIGRTTGPSVWNCYIVNNQSISSNWGKKHTTHKNLIGITLRILQQFHTEQKEKATQTVTKVSKVPKFAVNLRLLST